MFTHDVRSVAYSNGGTFLTCGNAACATPLWLYHFDRSGNLIPTTETRIGLPPQRSFVGGNGDNFPGRDGTQLGLYPKLDRYSANLIGHFEISPAFVPFIEAKYVRSDSL